MIQSRHEESSTLQARWLDEVRRIVVAHLGQLPVDVFLFGSRARGDSRVTSDIDLAIDSQVDLPPLSLAKLREALEECSVPVTCDVVDLRSASAGLRQRVRSEGQRWLTAKHG